MVTQPIEWRSHKKVQWEEQVTSDIREIMQAVMKYNTSGPFLLHDIL